MSRNFELLQRAQKEFRGPSLTKSETHVDVAAAAEPALAAAMVDVQLPPANAGVQPDIMSIVQRTFLSHAEPLNCLGFAQIGGDEPTSICAMVAEALLTVTRNTVCVVDANIGEPTVDQYFSMSNSVGLSDALTGNDGIEYYVHSSPDARLYVLPTGPGIANWQSLIISDPMKERVAELRSRFTHVLVNLPAFPASSTGIALSRMTDGVVLIIEAHQTRRNAASEIGDQLRHAGVPILGAVLNNRRFPIPHRIYRAI